MAYEILGNFNIESGDYIAWKGSAKAYETQKVGSHSGRMYILDIQPRPTFQINTKSYGNPARALWGLSNVRVDLSGWDTLWEDQHGGSIITYYSCFADDDNKQDNIYVTKTPVKAPSKGIQKHKLFTLNSVQRNVRYSRKIKDNNSHESRHLSKHEEKRQECQNKVTIVGDRKTVTKTCRTPTKKGEASNIQTKPKIGMSTTNEAEKTSESSSSTTEAVIVMEYPPAIDETPHMIPAAPPMPIPPEQPEQQPSDNNAGTTSTTVKPPLPQQPNPKDYLENAKNFLKGLNVTNVVLQLDCLN